MRSVRINVVLFVCLFFSESFRCGVFFAGENFHDLPRMKVFVVPKKFETDQCSAKGETHKHVEHGNFCTELVSTVPTDPFTISQPRIPSIDVSDLEKLVHKRILRL